LETWERRGETQKTILKRLLNKKQRADLIFVGGAIRSYLLVGEKRKWIERKLREVM